MRLLLSCASRCFALQLSSSARARTCGPHTRPPNTSSWIIDIHRCKRVCTLCFALLCFALLCFALFCSGIIFVCARTVHTHTPTQHVLLERKCNSLSARVQSWGSGARDSWGWCVLLESLIMKSWGSSTRASQVWCVLLKKLRVQSWGSGARKSQVWNVLLDNVIVQSRGSGARES